MKKRIACLLLAATLTAAITAGCGSDTDAGTKTELSSGTESTEHTQTADPEPENSEPENSEPENSEPESSEAENSEAESSKEESTEEANSETESPEALTAVSEEVEEAYVDLLEQYRSALKDRQMDPDELTKNGMSPLLYYEYGDDALKNVGYYLADTDENGVRELLIGSISSKDGLVFDAYTLLDDTPSPLLSSTEQDRFYLRENGTVYEEASDGSEITYYTIYDVEGDFLSEHRKIAYDTALDPKAPWFEVDGENFEPLSEEDYNGLLNKMTGKLVIPEYIPLEQ